MQGVTILSEQAVYKVDYLGWLFFLFLGIGFGIGLIVAIKDWVDFGWNANMIWLIFMTTIFGAYIGVVGLLFSKHETSVVDHIEYKVTVSDEVNFTDFMDNYELVDKEGLIYIIKEREVE